MKKIVFLLMLCCIIYVTADNKVLAITYYGYSSSGASSSGVYPSSIKIINAPKNINVRGKTYQFEVQFTPSNVTEKDITWSSSDNSILQVESNGKAIARKPGIVKVTATTINGRSDSVAITVVNGYTTSGGSGNLKNITIKNSTKEMLTGDTLNLKVQTNPSILKESTSFSFKSSNEKVLKVDSNGKVTAVGKGEATITVSSETNSKINSKIKITVKNAKIKLSASSVTINEGESKEITATITSNKKYSDNDINWQSTSTTNATVKKGNGSNNQFKATITGKKGGNSTIRVKIDNEVAEIKVKTQTIANDQSLECPIITYDVSNNSTINVTINPASTTKHWDYETSINKYTGENATWKLKKSNLSGTQTISSAYQEAQGRIKIYSSKGTSRYCYTVPFDLDGSKNSGIKVSSSLLNCPSKKYSFISDGVYDVELYNGKYIGVASADIKITPNTKLNYQYAWLSNKGIYLNSNGNYYYKYQAYRNFNKETNASLKASDEYDRIGRTIVIDSKGNVQSCYTDTISKLSSDYKKVATHGSTDVFTKKGESCNGSSNTINYINTLYKNAPYLFKNKSIYVTGSDAYTGGTWATSYVYLPCNDNTTYIGVIHEMAHVWDRVTGVKFGKRISQLDTFNTLKQKYNKSTNLASNSSLNCSYNWFYDQKNEFEFFVGIYTHYYLDKFYGNKSSSEIDKLHIHDCWKWMLKNRKIDNDIKNFIEDSIKKYK